MSNSVQRACALFAITSISALGALHGCGGGGDDDSGGNTAPTAPTPAPHEFLSVGLTSTNISTNKTLLLVDADAPGTPRLSAGLGDPFLNSPITSYRPRLDAGARTLTERAPATVYFANGLVSQVSLRKADSSAPRRISSIASACAVTAVHPLNFNDDAADDALVEVSEPGPDGNCPQSADNTALYVRSGSAATQAAMALPTGAKLISPLPNATGNAVFLIGDTSSSTPKLALYSADLTALGDVANSSNVGSVTVLGAASSASLNSAYVREGTSLRLLTWTPTSASLLGPIYSYRSGWPSAGLPSIADGTAFYFVDGLEVRRIVRGRSSSELLSTLNTANGTQVALLGASTSRLLLLQSTSDGLRVAIYSLPKIGGAAVSLQTLTSSAVNPLLGTHGDDVVVATSSTIWRASADGSNKQVITDHGSATKFGVRALTRDWGTVGDIDAIVWCEIPGTSSYCLNGTLKSQDLATGTTTTLGTFSHTSSISWYANNYGQATAGMPVALWAEAYPDLGSTIRKRDMYVVQPGKANSLVKITSELH